MLKSLKIILLCNIKSFKDDIFTSWICWKKIKGIRLNKGYSQEYMASKLGIKQDGYGKIERGVIKMTIDRLYEISRIFDVDIITLLDMDQDHGKLLENIKQLESTISQQKKQINEYEKELSWRDKHIELQSKMISLFEKQIDTLGFFDVESYEHMINNFLRERFLRIKSDKKIMNENPELKDIPDMLWNMPFYEWDKDSRETFKKVFPEKNPYYEMFDENFLAIVDFIKANLIADKIIMDFYGDWINSKG